MAKKDKSIDIIQYVERAEDRFDERPLTDVDSLVFTTLTYVKLEDIIAGETAKLGAKPGSLKFSVKDFWKTEYYELAFNDGIADEGNRRTMANAAGSRRYRDIPVREIVSITDPERCMQFAACVFEVTADTDYVCFRGTDGQLIGWREDFNMTFMDELPCQLEALNYINRLYGSKGPRRNRKLYVGGHSKGGHLALYAAAMCENQIKDRILEVFCHDSVGFRKDTYARFKQGRRFEDLKISKSVPQNSLIGMVMRSRNDFTVVRSNATGGIAQHSAFTWRVEGNDFVRFDGDITKGSYHDNAVQDWFSRADDTHRRLFTETVFNALETYGVTCVKDLAKLKTTDYLRMLDMLKDLEPDVKSAVRMTVLQLMGAMVIPRGVKKKKSF